jgi:hypothetical protein
MMKKLVFLLAFIFVTAISFGQSQPSILKQTKHFHITGNHAAAGVADSMIVVLQPDWLYSVQVWPHLAASADSIYSTVKLYQTNSDGVNAWSAIRINDNALYTASVFDTLVTGNATNGAFWLYKAEDKFTGVRMKLVITTLAKTNEDNDYTIYFIAKPAGTLAQIR